ncbi:MAG: hypothetical protein K6G15_05640 [Desulfovibrio sp.]|nr:hypothetical protein [Desulfovibrio sp.]
MKSFFLGRMAKVDLNSATISYEPLPAKASEQADLSVLCQDFADDAIFASGLLSASLAPAACVVTAYAQGHASLLKGHLACALKRTGLDALILQGKAKTPAGLLLNGETIALVELDPEADSESLRKKLLALQRKTFPGDTEPVCLITSQAALAGAKAPALVQDLGVAPNSGAMAQWLAAHNLCAMALSGTKPYPSPMALDHPCRSMAEAHNLTEKSLPDLLSHFAKAPKTDIRLGRAIACHACPAPCGCFLPGKTGFVACTSPEALAALLAKGASPERISELFRLSERFGLEPLALLDLASASSLPETLPELLAFVCAQEARPDDPQEKLASLLGVCPFFLRRFPDLAKALEEFCA